MTTSWPRPCQYPRFRACGCGYSQPTSQNHRVIVPCLVCALMPSHGGMVVVTGRACRRQMTTYSRMVDRRRPRARTRTRTRAIANGKGSGTRRGMMALMMMIVVMMAPGRVVDIVSNFVMSRLPSFSHRFIRQQNESPAQSYTSQKQLETISGHRYRPSYCTTSTSKYHLGTSGTIAAEALRVLFNMMVKHG